MGRGYMAGTGVQAEKDETVCVVLSIVWSCAMSGLGELLAIPFSILGDIV